MRRWWRKVKRIVRRHRRGVSVTAIVFLLLCGLVGWGVHHATPPTPVTPADRQRQVFIKQVAPVAQRAQRVTGVPASITLAQAALESDWGQSELARKYNNLFGVKGTGTDSAMMLTKEYVNGQWITVRASFVVYPTWQAAVMAHDELLAGNQRYAGVLRAPSYVAAARALQNGGYASDPDYAAKLIRLIRQYHLDRYD